jgi:hypothetical protein
MKAMAARPIFVSGLRPTAMAVMYLAHGRCGTSTVRGTPLIIKMTLED